VKFHATNYQRVKIATDSLILVYESVAAFSDHDTLKRQFIPTFALS